MELKMKDFFVIGVLKYFDCFLDKEGYVIKRLYYNPIVVDDYEIYYEMSRYPRIRIHFILARYYESESAPISIVFSRPKSAILGWLGIESHGYYEWARSRKTFYLEEVIKKFKVENFLKQQINNEENLSDILKTSSDFIQEHLIDVVRGEKWIDDIIAEHKRIR